MDMRLSLPRDEAALIEAVHAANLPTLMLVVVQLTGDPTLLRSMRPQRATPQRPDGGLDPEQARELRARALDALSAHAAGRPPAWPLPPVEVLHEMMSVSLGQAVPPEYVPMLVEDMRLAPAEPASSPIVPGASAFEVLVIGAGMSGLCAALELRRLGVGVRVIEKNSELGGTWFENSYPGCRVDMPSHFYSYSFAQNPDWSEHYAQQDELLQYFRRVAEDHALRALIEFDTEVVAAHYQPERARWRVTLRRRDGATREHEANALVSAVGQMNRPSIPALPGLDSFAGPRFHSAAWRHDVALAGKRVGVVGTGASAMQIVPKLAQEVEQLSIFQRSPQWALPSPDYFQPISPGERWALRHVPFYAPWYRFRQFYMNADGVHKSLQLDPSWPHPERAINASNDRLRQNLTEYITRELGDRQDLLPQVLPDYPPFAKRMLIDNHWFRTLTRDNVALLREPIARVTERGIQLTSGQHHELDVLVFATGFHANRFLWPMAITGAQGQLLHEHWGDEPRAHLGISVPGFPNLFLLYGPNTNLAHGGTIIFHSECQVRYIVGCLRLLLDGGHAAMEVTEAAHDAYNVRVDEAHARMVWTRPNARNWFRNQRGRVTTHSPFRLVDYWAMTRVPEPGDYRFSS